MLVVGHAGALKRGLRFKIKTGFSLLISDGGSSQKKKMNVASKETVFIDLRNFDGRQQQQQQSVERVQRVLGIVPSPTK